MLPNTVEARDLTAVDNPMQRDSCFNQNEQTWFKPVDAYMKGFKRRVTELDADLFYNAREISSAQCLRQ